MGKAGWGEQLVRNLQCAPSRRGLLFVLALTGAVCCSSQPSLFALAHAARLTTLMLLIKVLATVTVYRGCRRTIVFLPRIISLFITCIRIIWNNCGQWTSPRWGWSWTPAPECVTLYCTWCPSDLTTGLHGQVPWATVKIKWNCSQHTCVAEVIVWVQHCYILCKEYAVLE